MVLKACILAYTKDFPKDSTPAKGDETTVTANAILLIPEEIAAHYNIPVVEDVVAQSQQIVPSFTYTRYGNLADVTGTEITVPEFERSGGSGSSSAKNVVRLAHKTLKTARGKPRTCSIRFPGFFNLIMIGQALGTMLKANQPDKWKLDRTGKSYPLVPGTSTGVLTGYKTGAWVTSALITPTNADQTRSVAGTTVVSSKSKSS